MLHHHSQLKKLFSVCFYAAILCLMSISSNAIAGQTYNLDTPGTNDSFDYGSTPAYIYKRGSDTAIEIKKYSFEGHRAKIKYEYGQRDEDLNGLQEWVLDGGVTNTGGEIWLLCDTPNEDGGWHVKFVDHNMTCWDPIKATNVFRHGSILNNGGPVQIVGAKMLTRDEISIEPKSQCTHSSDYAPDGFDGTKKTFCSYGNGIDGNTGDDMFKLSPTVRSYFEYDKLGTSDLNNVGNSSHDEYYRLRFLNRSAAGSKDMMMPSGPPSIYSDYTNFLKKSPIEVKDACYKANIEVCENVTIEADYKIDGVCGEAANYTYTSIDEIQERYQCAYGVPGRIETNTSEKRFEWTCKGVGYDAASSQLATDATCFADIDSGAQCGAAHLEQFRNRGELTGSDSPYSGKLCTGTSSPGSVTGSGPWFWTCDANVGETKAYCTGLVQGQNCDRLFSTDKMIVVQDTSGSFDDDIGNTRTGLSYLFNNSLFEGWDVALTSYSDFGRPYAYRIDKRFTDLDTDLAGFTSTYGALSPRGGGDGPESQVYAMIKSIDDFAAQTNKDDGFIMIMITDHTSHTGGRGGRYETFATLADKMKEHNVRVIGLTTSNVRIGLTTIDLGSWYTQRFTNAGVADRFSQQDITSNSSDLASALLEGLIDLGCDDAPIDGTCGLAIDMPGSEYSSPTDIPENEACIAGGITAMTDRGDRYTWVCGGINGGGPSEQCEYLLAACGNGVRENTEACDDGNSINIDSCTNQCEKRVYNTCDPIDTSVEKFYSEFPGYSALQTEYEGEWRYFTEDDPETVVTSDPGTTPIYSESNNIYEACDFGCADGYERIGGNCIATSGADACVTDMITDGVFVTGDENSIADALTEDGRCFGFYAVGYYPRNVGPSETYDYWQFTPTSGANKDRTLTCCQSK